MPSVTVSVSVSPYRDRMKIITPVRVLFNLDSSKIAAQPARFTEFLKQLRAALSDTGSELAQTIHPAVDVEVNVLPKYLDNGSDSSRDHSRFYLFPQIFTLRFRASFRQELAALYADAAKEADAAIAPYSQFFCPDLESLALRFNDNTVAVLLLDLPLNPDVQFAREEGWNRLNEWAGVMVKHLLRGLYPTMIFPFLKGLIAFSRQTKEDFIYDVAAGYKIFFVLVGDPENPYPDLHQRFIPMKSHLVFCTQKGYAPNHWTSTITQHCITVKEGETEYHIGDENILITLSPEREYATLSPVWELFSAASYYLIAMNVINVNLVRYIGITGDRHSHKALRVITRDTENIINSVTILKVRYHDLLSELTGTRKKLFLALQKEWNFQNIVQNMQNKLDLCHLNIKTLNVEMQRRNQGRIEIVLTGVACMSIMSVFIELSSYATQLPPENKGMVGNVIGFMDLGFVLSGNMLGWVGFVMASAVMAFAVKHRSG
jgi:hypothetical protein